MVLLCMNDIIQKTERTTYIRITGLEKSKISSLESLNFHIHNLLEGFDVEQALHNYLL